ncbi:CoA transferase [uncultured Schumannella sp.]|uniref:CoA transferase n=1 Tax=uncultured Schumannella sp. TaxID=1195956 RepID=UPI0025FD5B98|nr:CoA transferase [uncultured Schumannella sp.]
MDDDATSWMRERFTAALGIAPRPIENVGEPRLVSSYPVSALATASIGAAASAAAELIGEASNARPAVRVDRALADVWFGTAVTPVGWSLPSPWDSIAGDYEAADGWIRLHTNAPHHRAAALRVLGVAGEREEVARAVAVWNAGELETAVVNEGGCAAELRSPAEWAAHPQGAAVAQEPLIGWGSTGDSSGVPSGWEPTAERPLAGLRVLDLTRVLAGPVATRLLAGLGANVLRIDPPGWAEPALELDLTLGKHCALVDGRDPAGLERLLELLASADVLVHGYRPGALDSFDFGEAVRRATRPGLVEVSLDAYGHTGPWARRRGFDSLVQMSSGIAAAGLLDGTSSTPTPLPVQALDHATGYLMAAAALAGVTRRVRGGEGSSARLSLARTALELESAPRGDGDVGDAGAARERAVIPTTPIESPWGPAARADPPFQIEGAPLSWERAPRALGSDPSAW